MPGVILHLLTGSLLYLIGRSSFRTYFKQNPKYQKDILLAVVCLLFSILPDFFLGLHYVINLEPVNVLMPFQDFTHLVLTPIAIGILLPIIYYDTKRRPIWVMGIIALTLHIIMDFFIMETSWII